MLPEPSRRAALKVIGTTITVSLLPSFLIACSSETINPVGEKIISELNHIEIASEIGKIHIEQSADLKSATFNQITQRLLNKLDIKTEVIDTGTLEKRLRDQINLDFVTESFVIVDGWMLSETEALLCALAYTYPAPT